MVTLRPDKNLYFNKGLTRKKQIYSWFMEVVLANNLGNKFKNVIQFGRLGEKQKALDQFTDIINTIIDDRPMRENGDTLGYLLQENINAFGKVGVVLDLFNGIVLIRTGVIRKRPKEKVEKITLAEIREEIKEDIVKNVFLGINIVGTREEGILKTRKNNTFYLQSRKTGRFLKLTKSLRSELRKRNQ